MFITTETLNNYSYIVNSFVYNTMQISPNCLRHNANFPPSCLRHNTNIMFYSITIAFKFTEHPEHPEPLFTPFSSVVSLTLKLPEHPEHPEPFPTPVQFNSNLELDNSLNILNMLNILNITIYWT